MSGATGVNVVVLSISRDSLIEAERETLLEAHKGVGSIVVRRLTSIGKHILDEVRQLAKDALVYIDMSLEELRTILIGISCEDCPPIHLIEYWSSGRTEPVAIKRIGGGLEKPVTVWVHSGYLLASAFTAL